MGLRNAKKRKSAVSFEVLKTLKALDLHIKEMQPFVPLSPNEQLLRYLQRTYEYGRKKIKITDNAALKRELLKRLPNIRMKGPFNKFRILLELQSPTSPSEKQRRRHARALLMASMSGVKSDRFLEFVKANGGVNRLGDMAFDKSRPLKKSAAKKSTKGKAKYDNVWED